MAEQGLVAARAPPAHIAPLLDLDVFRFVGDDTPWQDKGGLEKMTDPKDYVVEVKTRSGEHLILTFKLVYDW